MLQAMTSAAGLPSMLDREELIGQTMQLRAQHAEVQQRAEALRKVRLNLMVEIEFPLQIHASGSQLQDGNVVRRLSICSSKTHLAELLSLQGTF